MKKLKETKALEDYEVNTGRLGKIKERHGLWYLYDLLTEDLIDVI